MTAPAPYFHFLATARDALNFYQGVFGGELTIHTYAEFSRDDGPSDAVAHGILNGPVSLFAADASAGESPFTSSGLMFSLLGTRPPDELRAWFRALALGGVVRDELQQRPWGDWDGQVVDRFGVCWLIGFEDSSS